ncbi:MAG: divalent-cation tolerance protein CutA [Chlorobiaceae bacterium]|nr:divalent-cation tolerance protein CutA [Chlorobiaceae bacterium]
MKSSYCMVITTVPDRDEAEHLAEGILENRLAACVQMADIRSFFLWEGALQKEDEVALWIKTTDERYSDLEVYILEHHPYDVPEIIKLPVTGGLPGYLNWLDLTIGNERQGLE